MQWSLFVLILMGQCSFCLCYLYEYHFVKENKTWTEAQAYCREKYTDLATVFDMTDVKRLNDSAEKPSDAWIGLRKQTDVSRTWLWSLPEVTFNGSETRWADNEPHNNGKFPENCVTMNKHGWYDVHCSKTHPFICYNETETKTFHFIKEEKTWLQAQSYCREHHTDLVSGLKQLNDSDFMTETKPQSNEQSDESSSESKTKPQSNEQSDESSSESKTKPQSNEQSDESSSESKTKPQSNEQSDESSSESKTKPQSNKQSDESSSESKTKPQSNEQSDESSSESKTKPQSNEQSDESSSESKTKPQSNEQSDESSSESKTKPQSNEQSDESSSESKTKPQSNKPVWIGLFRDTWRWSDKSHSSFRFWDPKQFEDKDEKECAMTVSNGKWISDKCSKKKHFFCYDDEVVLIKENKTWVQALTYCRENYHELVSITDPFQQRWVEEKVKRASTTHVWTGLRYTCTLGFWFWITDEAVHYKNWEPDHKTHECELDDCHMSGAMETGGKHEWFKKDASLKFNFICTKR